MIHGLDYAVDTLKALIASVEEGDFAAFGPLADYLEERGDPRADLARGVMTLEPPLIAQLLCESRETPPSDGTTLSWMGMDLLLFGGWAIIMPVLALLGAASSLTAAVPPASPNLGLVIQEVEEAIRTRKLTQEVTSAITVSRLIKRDHLLTQLRDEYCPS